jgi:phosphopantothenate synthetase
MATKPVSTIFEQIEDLRQQYADYKSNKKHDTVREDKKQEHIASMRLLASQMEFVFKDGKFKIYENFVIELQKSLTELLIKSGKSGKTIDDTALQCARLSAQVEILNYIITYPKQLIRMVQELQEKEKK